ncbi:uncharacterized protein LOC134540948 [Bacillus rossius redtenbacheri]|uniref:uncharacterized protein LOC134540948 n=1 Tax=Bacillus rossius redtenbacheri TaxID=93214 RepID=UPI002FDDA936
METPKFALRRGDDPDFNPIPPFTNIFEVPLNDENAALVGDLVGAFLLGVLVEVGQDIVNPPHYDEDELEEVFVRRFVPVHAIQVYTNPHVEPPENEAPSIHGDKPDPSASFPELPQPLNQAAEEQDDSDPPETLGGAA